MEEGLTDTDPRARTVATADAQAPHNAMGSSSSSTVEQEDMRRRILPRPLGSNQNQNGKKKASTEPEPGKSHRQRQKPKPLPKETDLRPKPLPYEVELLHQTKESVLPPASTVSGHVGAQHGLPSSSFSDPRAHAEERRKEQQHNEALQRATTLLAMETEFEAERERALQSFMQDGQLHCADRLNESIGRQVRNMWENSRPTFARLSARSRILADIKLILDKRWRNCGLEVVPFGSSLTGLLEATSDLDLCLLDPSRPHGMGTPASEVLPLPKGAEYQTLDNPHVVGMVDMPDYYSVKLIARALERRGYGTFKDIIPIWHAAVPIVKFVHRPTGVACDLNVNDTFGLRNSALIKAYIDLAPDFVGPLLFCIKKWASKRNLNDPSGANGPASMNSYSLCLFTLQYLQVRGVLPNLQSTSLLEELGVKPSHVWQRPKGLRSKKQKATTGQDSNTATKLTPTTEIESATTDNTIGTDVLFITAAEETTTSAESNEEAKMEIASDPLSGSRRFDTSFVTLVTENDRQRAEIIARQSKTPGEPYSADWKRTANQAEKDAALGQLLLGFFEWMDTTDFDKCGISLREGHPVRRISELEPKDAHLGPFPYVHAWEPRWEQHPFLCQDPFILDRNTCTAINPKVRKLFLQEVRRAVEILSSTLLKDEGQSSSAFVLSELLVDEEYEKLRQKHERSMRDWTDEQRERLMKDVETIRPRIHLTKNPAGNKSSATPKKAAQQSGGNQPQHAVGVRKSGKTNATPAGEARGNSTARSNNWRERSTPAKKDTAPPSAISTPKAETNV